ncbi:MULTISPECIES: hypothetical protein [unclassified Lentimicrobium]|uniref:hypothetical protein n=1 Tax=unclassified Lentimicrobium TaxID=2677434 RepID=UPI001554DB92|nr:MULTISPECIES: hypothetical protein [unclassified Lentimicrobium]NPD44590.1 hypothetical protein [Lentimicrobium sp. S6]NPD83302.1 hypothetical protein [Lentimicrobium sp. L6]
MKSIYFIIIFLLSSLFSFSQDKYKDIIYPVSGGDSITECQILKIKNWNTIIYEKDDFQDTVLAIAAIKNGRFIDFRTREEIKANAYPLIFSSTNEKERIKGEAFFQAEYQKALKQKKGGAKFSLLGGAIGAITYGVMYRNNKNNESTRYFIPALFIGGGVLFNLGTPLWISGSIKAKKSEDAMLKHKQKDISLNMGMTNSGIGLIIKF